MIIGHIERKTNIRFKNMEDFESFENAISVDYDNGDVIFNGYVYKLETPQFKVVKRSGYPKGSNFMQQIFEFCGQNCYIPIGGDCFIKFIKFLTGKYFAEDFLTFIRTEQRRSNVTTSARIQPFCRKHNINIGCFDGKKINPRSITEKDSALKKHDNHFCLIWKSQGVSFTTAIENESKPIFKVFDNVITDKHVNS